MQPEQQVGHHIEQRHWPTLETAHHVGIHLAAHEFAIGTNRIDHAKSEVEQMPDEEQQHDDARQPH